MPSWDSPREEVDSGMPSWDETGDVSSSQAASDSRASHPRSYSSRASGHSLRERVVPAGTDLPAAAPSSLALTWMDEPEGACSQQGLSSKGTATPDEFSSVAEKDLLAQERQAAYAEGCEEVYVEAIKEAESPTAHSRDSQRTKGAAARLRRCSGTGFSCSGFPLCCANCPITAAVVLAIIVPVLLVVMWPGIEVSTDFDSFLEADSEANDIRAAFMKALPLRGNLGSGRRLQIISASAMTLDPDLMHKITTLKLLYRAKTDAGLMSYEALSAMRDMELRLKGLPAWRKICSGIVSKALQVMCDPGYSFVNVVWPEQEEDASGDTHLRPHVPYNLTGRGLEPLPLEAAVALSKAREIDGIIFPLDFEADKPVMFMRSAFEFNLKCCMVYDTMATRRENLGEIDRAYHSFIIDELYPTLIELNNNDLVQVFWEGNLIDAREMWVALKGDLFYALGSVFFIMFYLTAHTRSFFISSVALFLVLLAIPTAFVTSAYVGSGNRVTGASFLSLFLMVGLGADVVLVFITFWGMYKDTDTPASDEASRIRYLYRTAGLSCLATSLTTAASFFANLASVLRPLREFGFFMGLCILYTYIFLFICLPALFVIKERVDRRSCCCCCCRSRRRRPPSSTDTVAQPEAVKNTGRRQLPSFRESLSVYIDRLILPYNRSCLGSFVLALFIFAIWTTFASELDDGIPAMFPKGHNQRDIPKVREQFGTTTLPWWSGSMADVCNVRKELPRYTRGDSCQLNWCSAIGEAPPLEFLGRAPSASNATALCECKATEAIAAECKRIDPTASAIAVESSVRFVGLDKASIPVGFFSSMAWRQHLAEVVGEVNGVSLRLASAQPISAVQPIGTLVQEHWESGLVHIAPYLQGPDSILSVHNNIQPTLRFPEHLCRASEICYCGAPACRLADRPSRPRSLPLEVPIIQTSPRAGPDFRRLGTGELEEEVQRGAGLQEEAAAEPTHLPHDRELALLPPRPPLGRGLALGRRLSDQLIDVTLVWGIEVLHRAPLLGKVPKDNWGFSPDFTPQIPSVQRHLLSACRKSREKDLLVVRTTCWPEDFRTYLHSRGLMFPARATAFKTLLLQFVRGNILPSGLTAKELMWFDDSGNLKATYAQFHVGMSYTGASSTAIIEYKTIWDRFLVDLRSEAPKDGGMPWHTSRLWIRAEAEAAIIDSTVSTLIVSIGCGFFGALCFTHGDLGLSMLVVLSVVGVTVSLAWFMCVVMRWKTGAIEVLGLIVFVGYSLTYSLHIAHKYQEKARSLEKSGMTAGARRKAAVSFALSAMTSAVLGSAMTTLGSSFFLFFCTIRIFMKLATVLFAVTFFAAAFAVAALPAALAWVGPLGSYSRMVDRCVAFVLKPVLPRSFHAESAPEDKASAITTDPPAIEEPGVVDGTAPQARAETPEVAEMAAQPLASVPVLARDSSLQSQPSDARALAPSIFMPMSDDEATCHSGVVPFRPVSPSFAQLGRGSVPPTPLCPSGTSLVSPGALSIGSTAGRLVARPQEAVARPQEAVGSRYTDGSCPSAPEVGQSRGQSIVLRSGSWPGIPTGGPPPRLPRPSTPMAAVDELPRPSNSIAAADAHPDSEGATVGGGVRSAPTAAMLGSGARRPCIVVM